MLKNKVMTFYKAEFLDSIFDPGCKDLPNAKKSVQVSGVDCSFPLGIALDWNKFQHDFLLVVGAQTQASNGNDCWRLLFLW